MKKILSTITVATLAAAVQAVTVTWSTGTMYAAKDAEGTWTATSGTTGRVAQNSAVVSIFLVTEATFETYLEKSADEVYAAGSAGNIANIAKNTGLKSNAGGLVTWKEGNYSTGDKAYAIFIVDYTDPTYGSFTAVGFGAMQVGDSGVGKLVIDGTSYAVNTSINNVAKWTPATVPEPTTLALLALGLAAVGLKRKVA